jgi:hypothetical protein
MEERSTKPERIASRMPGIFKKEEELKVDQKWSAPQ